MPIQITKLHSDRIGVLSWGNNRIASGSKDCIIHLGDPRSNSYNVKLKDHTGEVCGLKWSFNDQHLASGGDDNKLLVWNIKYLKLPTMNCQGHSAAVRGIAWSPHQKDVFASGGGSADGHIRFWDVFQNKSLKGIKTGSQVCNLLWSKNINEVISTHNTGEICLWNYPSRTEVASFIGHEQRILYMALSHDGQKIMTGAGAPCETLRIWNIAPSSKLIKRENLKFSYPCSFVIR